MQDQRTLGRAGCKCKVRSQPLKRPHARGGGWSKPPCRLYGPDRSISGGLGLDRKWAGGYVDLGLKLAHPCNPDAHPTHHNYIVYLTDSSMRPCKNTTGLHWTTIESYGCIAFVCCSGFPKGAVLMRALRSD